MTAKHNSKHARNNLWVAKHRAATAKSDPRKQDHDARQQALMAKTKASRGMAALLASLDEPTKITEDAAENDATQGSAGPEAVASPKPRDPSA
jgi:hypothetical protein